MRTRRPWAALTLLLACTPQGGGDTDATTAAVTDSTPGTDSTDSSEATDTATTGPTFDQRRAADGDDDRGAGDHLDDDRGPDRADEHDHRDRRRRAARARPRGHVRGRDSRTAGSASSGGSTPIRSSFRRIGSTSISGPTRPGSGFEFFGNDPVPHSGRFLLYYAPGWNNGAKSTVLLAHGANDQADRAWANPGESGDFGCGQSTCPDIGLMQELAAAGHRVFAVSHAHSQGDNVFWALQIAWAIDIIRERTGVDKVDVIGWSKGVMSSRMYASGLTGGHLEYRGDIDKLILIGGPNLGFDYIFRYGTAHNAGVYADFGGKIHAPGPHDELLIFGLWEDRSEYAIYKSAAGDNYRGQLQMLAAWDDVYPLTGTANNGLMQWIVGDSESTYYGEGQYKGVYARGKGIDYAIQQGSVIADMIDAGIPASISTHLLCGDLNLNDNSVLIPGIPNEIAGPSDGVVFVDSCAATDGIGTLTDSAVLKDINHLKLGWHPTAAAQILTWLGQ
ncbi:esterase/lipase family protein [Nannocystis pusilla]|uniref:esterase/lipase family protein n=1 Tax=Nannocystis pusilla TaxID=889268 RepID=UPI003DA460AD